MDKRYRLNCRMNTNIIITNFWLEIASIAKAISVYAAKHAERRLKRNVHLSKVMEKENYPQSFETQLVSVSKEYGQ